MERVSLDKEGGQGVLPTSQSYATAQSTSGFISSSSGPASYRDDVPVQLWVGNLNVEVNIDTLFDIFSQKVVVLNIIPKRSFAFVTVRNEEDGDIFASYFHGRGVEGSGYGGLVVQFAEKQQRHVGSERSLAQDEEGHRDMILRRAQIAASVGARLNRMNNLPGAATKGQKKTASSASATPSYVNPSLPSPTYPLIFDPPSAHLLSKNGNDSSASPFVPPPTSTQDAAGRTLSNPVEIFIGLGIRKKGVSKVDYIEKLEALFRPHVEFDSFVIPRGNTKNTVYAFTTVASEADFQKAVNCAAGQRIRGREITVERAIKRRDHTSYALIAPSPIHDIRPPSHPTSWIPTQASPNIWPSRSHDLWGSPLPMEDQSRFSDDTDRLPRADVILQVPKNHQTESRPPSPPPTSSRIPAGLTSPDLDAFPESPLLTALKLLPVDRASFQKLSRIFSKPPAPSFARSVYLSATFGHLTPHEAAEALDCQLPFQDEIKMQDLYAEFLLCQMGESKEVYFRFLERMTAATATNDEFGKVARGESRR